MPAATVSPASDGYGCRGPGCGLRWSMRVPFLIQLAMEFQRFTIVAHHIIVVNRLKAKTALLYEKNHTPLTPAP
jgi:hypothetical protein